MDKKVWETYQESKGDDGDHSEDAHERDHGVLFDVDAIRAELAKEHLEVRELQATLPPMKLEQASIASDHMEVRELKSTLPPMKLEQASIASGHLEVRELKSTLPPMKLDLNCPAPIPVSPRLGLRETKSYDAGATTDKPNVPASPLLTHGFSSRRVSSDQTPFAPGPRSPYLHPDDDAQMSFDTAYHSPARSSTSFSKPRSPSPAWSLPIAEPTERAATLQRPELKSSTTLPAMSMNLEHNAWADDDDEFREKEMEMTFA
jgi:hypothetical protein